jgi:PKD repeat protein
VFSDAPTLPPDVVPTGLHIHATPTPVPVITLPPPTPTPKATPGPSPKPTVKPTPKPSTAPSAAPAPPVASFSCTASTGYVLTCTDASINATGWVWHWGDGTTSGVQNPAPHTYTASDPNPIQVTLDVTGPGGSDSQSIYFTLLP